MVSKALLLYTFRQKLNIKHERNAYNNETKNYYRHNRAIYHGERPIQRNG